jgi:hypothetical protein
MAFADTYIGCFAVGGLPYEKRGIPIVRNVSLNVTYPSQTMAS